MTERPILFSGPMVRAILEGRKTQTRRLVTCRHPISFIGPAGEEHDPRFWGYFFDGPDHNGYAVLGRGLNDRENNGLVSMPCPYGVPGDRLWVRETFALGALRTDPDPDDQDDWFPVFRADGDERPWLTSLDEDAKEVQPPWRPSIFMPRWVSRITLEVADVRVQRLQDITPADAVAEGAAEVLDVGHPLRAECYASHGTWTGDDDLDVDGPFAGAVAAYATLWDSINAKRASWSSNPWVWAVTFAVVR